MPQARHLLHPMLQKKFDCFTDWYDKFRVPVKHAMGLADGQANASPPEELNREGGVWQAPAPTPKAGAAPMATRATKAAAVVPTIANATVPPLRAIRLFRAAATAVRFLLRINITLA